MGYYLHKGIPLPDAVPNQFTFCFFLCCHSPCFVLSALFFPFAFKDVSSHDPASVRGVQLQLAGTLTHTPADRLVACRCTHSDVFIPPCFCHSPPFPYIPPPLSSVPCRLIALLLALNNFIVATP
jgi:hypothetical protein